MKERYLCTKSRDHNSHETETQRMEHNSDRRLHKYTQCIPCSAQIWVSERVLKAMSFFHAAHRWFIDSPLLSDTLRLVNCRSSECEQSSISRFSLTVEESEQGWQKPFLSGGRWSRVLYFAPCTFRFLLLVMFRLSGRKIISRLRDLFKTNCLNLHRSPCDLYCCLCLSGWLIMHAESVILCWLGTQSAGETASGLLECASHLQIVTALGSRITSSNCETLSQCVRWS